MHRTTEEGLLKAIELLLAGDSMDLLWVSRREDLYSGLTVSTFEGAPVLNASFNTAREQLELQAFRAGMSQLGYVAEES